MADEDNIPPEASNDGVPAKKKTNRGAKKGQLGNGNSSPRCKAHTTKGAKCKNIAMANGCCRKHGGLSTGPRTVEGRIAISNANMSHGLYQKPSFDLLRPEERRPEFRIPHNAKQAVEDEIFLIEIFQRRIMKRMDEIELEDEGKLDIEQQFESKKTGEAPEVDPISGAMSWKPVYNMVETIRKELTRDKMERLNAQQVEFARLSTLKGKYIELREKLETNSIQEEDGSLDQLVKIIGKARERFDGPTEPKRVVIDAEVTVSK